LNPSTQLLDSGVWIALAFATHPAHLSVRGLFEAADSLKPIAFCRATQTSVLRLLTTSTIQAAYGSSPISNREAWSKTQEILSLPQVVWLAEPPGLESAWKNFAASEAASPKLWMDAYLMAFACCAGIELVTLDRGFLRYGTSGVRLKLIETTAS
jgi:toxin-antitoxin system PIN domain toxin